MKTSTFLGASALAGSLLLLSNGALAQTAPTTTSPSGTTQGKTANEIDNGDKVSPAPAGSLTSANAAVDNTSEVGGQDILVTGTRIPVRNTIDAAIPVVSISAAELLGARGDVSLGDALNQLPQLRSTFSQANSTGSIGTAGLSLLDLRGLGTARTLTLVNGRRVVSAVPGSYTPDISTLPFDLVERVEVVTGGNSAVYGSDAIAGVVNLITRRNFDGIKLRAQSGISTYGDRGTQLVSGIVGRNFLDGKVNLTVTSEYSHASSVFYANRDYLGAFDGNPAFITSQITTAPNRNFDGIPNTSFVPRGSKFGTRSLGGTVITNCSATATAANAIQRANVCAGINSPTGSPLAYNYVFQPDGSLLKDSPATTGLTDNRAIGGGFLFGATATGTEDRMLLPRQDRWVSNILLSGDFSSAFKPFLEASYARIKVEQQSSQPTFNGGTLTATYSINNPFLTPAARATLVSILAPGATSFTSQRFNNDFGTRAEFHTRETFRAVAGVGGQISAKGNIRYEVAGNYGRTDNFYQTGGNVLLQQYANSQNAVLAPTAFTGSNFVLNSQGQRVICAINATTNADPACYPVNLFGQGAPDQRALNYLLYTSTRRQWAEQIDATAFISGDSSGFFSLPGGPVGFAIGGEYRREDAKSTQDPITTAGLTFLNPAASFNPPAVNIKEAYGELRIPLLANIPLIHELTFEGSGRVSDYGGNTGSVVAWGGGGIWAPFRDLRFRGVYSRSVRAPNLSNLYATAAQTFQNGLTDPCDQPGGTNSANNITTNPNRARNCAAAGIPTTITFTDPTSGAVLSRPWTNQPTAGVAGVNQGNINLVPEIGYSFTLGGAYTPSFVPGLSFKVDYYNIRVKNVISGLTGQAIINRCYDDPVSTANPFCSAVFRRASTDSVLNQTFLGQSNRVIDQSTFTLPVAGNAFINQPFNFAQLKTRGIDFESGYVHKFREDLGFSARVVVSYVMDRISYSYITEPGRFDRFDSTLGDPKWQGTFTLNANIGKFDLNYNARYVGQQIVSGLAYETFFASQGRPATNPDARPFIFYKPVVYHSVRLGTDINEKSRFYLGVDNVSNELPPYELDGTGNDAIYPNQGRFFYAGFEAKF